MLFMFFSLFWIQSPVLAGDSVNIEDFYQCDDLLCPKESVGRHLQIVDTDLKAIGVNEEIGNRRKIELYNKKINRKPFELIRNPVIKINGENVSGGSGNDPMGVDGGTNNQNDLLATQKDNSPDGDSSFYSKESSPGNKSHISSSLSGGNSSQIRYSRLKGSISSGTGGQNTKIRTGGGANTHINLALLNKQNSKMGFPTKSPNSLKKRDQSARPSLGSSRGQSLGGEAGASGRKTKKPKSFLSRLANRLGFGRYFGTPGRRGASYQKKGYNYGRSGSKTNNFYEREKLKTPSDILKERFNRQFKRGLANNLEFETPKTSIFQKMCEHYDNYTRANNIPDNQRFCPKSQ